MKLDVAIVGASSAGLHAAALLARAGKRVAVFEKHENLDRSRRTLIVTPELYRFVEDLPPSAAVHRISDIAVSTPGASLRIHLQEPDLIVERSALIRVLAERALSAGAEICYQCRFVSIRPLAAGASIQLRVDGGVREVEAAALIGADGVNSTVAHAVGLPLPPSVPIIQTEIRLPPDWNPSLTQVWFDAAGTRYFYWLIPESATHGVVGVVADAWSETSAALERFVHQAGFEPLAHQASAVALHHPRLRPWGRVGAAPVYLIGDAAGQVKVTTVGGTVSGFWGAEAAARSLLRGSPYGAELRALKQELDLHRWIRLLLDRLDNAGYDELVHSLGPFATQFLGKHNRDAMARPIWLLLLRQPALLGLGLRLLLQRPSARMQPGPEWVRDAE